MRFKTYTAPSSSMAMQLVRQELGEDAIILSTQQVEKNLVQVTAAIESPDLVACDFALPKEGQLSEDIYDTIAYALEAHGVPAELNVRLVDMASKYETHDPAFALAGALQSNFGFSSFMPVKQAQRYILVGPPGSGKTVTTAKLAARFLLANQPLEILTADTIRAGGIEQLEAYIRMMKLNLETIETPEQMTYKLQKHEDCNFLIDTWGTNPFDEDDLSELQELILLSGSEPILVLPAGIDTAEAIDLGHSYDETGVKKVIITRLDATRRLGSALSMIDHLKFEFTEGGCAPYVADGLMPLTPVTLANLILNTNNE